MKRSALGLLVALFPSLAFAQGALLQAGPSAPGRVPQYVSQGNSQAIVQDSGPAAGGGPGLGLAELLLTMRGHGQPPYAGQGSGPLGTNFCNYDAPTTNPTGYHYLCFSPNTQGSGLLIYGAGGTASPLPFFLVVNGTTFSFPGAGTGDVAGPVSSVPGHVAVFADTTGKVIADDGLLPPAQIAPTSAGNLLIDSGTAVVSRPVTGAFTLSGAGVATIESSIALPGSPTTTTPAFTDNSTTIATTAYVQGQVACTSATAAGLVGDGVTLNDTAFNTWWNSNADCLDFGKGKFAFGAQIDKTLAPAPQTIQLASGTYNSATGIASVTATAALTFPAGSSITVWNAAGTGAFASMNGTFTALSVSGSTATYAIQPGLGATTLTGGGISGANRRTGMLKGAASNLTRLYWPNASCGIKITQGGTDSQFGAFASSFHIRDMTLAAGVANCGIALDLEGHPYAFGVPPVTDMENVEIEGDDRLAPIEGSLYWSAALNINCWSNINAINVNTYGNFGTEKGVGLIYGCNQGTALNPTYAVILNVSQSSFNGHMYGVELLSYWQGVTLNQVNINAENGAGTAGVILAGGQTGVLSGLAITSSQFGQLNNPIALGPATGSAVSGLNITNNTLFVSIANATGMQIGTNGNLALLGTVTGNTFIGNPSLTSTFGITGEMQGISATGNVFDNIGVPVDIAAGSSNLVVTGNSAFGAIALPLANAGCTNCVIANNPGINPIGVTPSTTVGTSPATICASSSPETHYFTQSATFTATVKLGTASGPVVGTMASAATPVVTNLGPNECEVVTWATTAPTYSKSIH